MKRLFSLTLLLLVLSAAGCKKDPVLYYNDISFVNATEGVYVSDAGVEYVIVENATDREIPRNGRMIFACDILQKVRTGVFNVRLNGFSVPLVKDPVLSSGSPADDPVSIEGGWISGGYFNTLLGFYLDDASSVKHLINLEYTLPTESNDTLYLQLTHDALGEVPVNPADETDAYSYVRTYACFPLDGLLPSGTEVPVKVLWKWYDSAAEDPAECRMFFHKMKLLF